MSTRTLTALGMALLLGAMGCAKRQQQEPVATPTPNQYEASFQQGTPTPVPALPTPEPTPRRNSYIVRKGDTLWDISAKPDILGDNFRWPLLFRANRDQIIDPDLIEPAQDLTWRDNYTRDEIADAVQKARDTPPYVPHSKPRKQLPLKY